MVVERMENGLTAPQEKFCREYARVRNGTRAAIEAGYSPYGAHSQAWRLLNMPKIQARLCEMNIPLPEKRVDWRERRILDGLQGPAAPAQCAPAASPPGRQPGQGQAEPPGLALPPPWPGRPAPHQPSPDPQQLADESFVLRQLLEVYWRCTTPEPVRGQAGTYKFDSRGALRALELIARQVGLIVGPEDAPCEVTKLDRLEELLQQVRAYNQPPVSGGPAAENLPAREDDR